MKTPANPFTIHVIAPQEVIPYVAPRQPSRVYRVRPYMAETLTRTGHGVVQTSRLAMFVVTQLCRVLVGVGVGVVHGIRFLYLMALCFLMFTIACGWEILDALYRGWFHLPRL
jgi:hypothetical protein